MKDVTVYHIGLGGKNVGYFGVFILVGLLQRNFPLSAGLFQMYYLQLFPVVNPAIKSQTALEFECGVHASNR